MNRLMSVVLVSLGLQSFALAQINWTEQTVTSEFDNARSVYAIDLDKDGDIDVLGAAYEANDITWWENEGDENFTEHTIADNFGGAQSVFAIDLDGDAYVDVLAAGWGVGAGIFWWENDGNQNFTQHTIADQSAFPGANLVYAIDLDGDGDNDVLGAGFIADEIAWWENDGNGNFTLHVIAANFDGARSVFAIDLDGDGDVDVLGAASIANDITWWENDGDENFTEHTIAGNYLGPYSVYAIDLDGDGDNDVLGAATDADDITWWENDGNENFTEHTIADNFDYALSVYAIDLDGDGDIDVLGAASLADDITWWENDGDENFTEHTIANNFDGPNAVHAIDLDGDTYVDVLGAAGIADDIIWWRNRPIHDFDVAVMSINIPLAVPQDTILNPRARIANLGTNSAGFNVRCYINYPEYQATEMVNLEPEADTQITFSTPYCFAAGFHTVTVFTMLATDENPHNDTLEKVVNAYDPGVAEGNADSPKVFSFGLKNNPTAKALFNLALPQDALITLKVYDVSGRLINKVSGHKSAGYYQIPWMKANAGVYFYIFESLGHKETGKLVIIY